MSAAQTVRKYYRRFLGLGWARVFLILGVVLALIALANPVWSRTNDHGGGSYTTWTYGWTTVTSVRYDTGVWAETLIQSYPASGADVIANSIGNSYLAAVVFIVVSLVVIALFSIDWIQRLPSLGLLIVALVVLVFALVALLYPVLTVPSAAAADLNQPAITGYWGSVVTPGATVSWGAGLGWWLLLVGVILGIVGGLWPYVQALRNPVGRVPPPPPHEWQVER